MSEAYVDLALYQGVLSLLMSRLSGIFVGDRTRITFVFPFSPCNNVTALFATPNCFAKKADDHRQCDRIHRDSRAVGSVLAGLDPDFASDTTACNEKLSIVARSQMPTTV